MGKSTEIIKKYISGALIILLFVPLLQKNLNFIKEKPLHGAVNVSENIEFNFYAWFNGSYQSLKEKELNETFGFRNYCVRLNNQFDWTFFRKINAKGVVVGKQNYLFEEDYIRTYFGLDFVGVDPIKQRFEKMKFLHDTLKLLNKQLVLVYAASKGSFYPEYFPDKYNRSIVGETNYAVYTQYSALYGLNFIDFNRYFLENKGETKYPLFPQHGIHWSQYGTCIASDSIIRYIETLCNIDLPNVLWDSIVWDYPNGVDYDLADGMNLLFKFNSFKMGYPNVRIQKDENKQKPSLLVVADSYYWAMFNFGFGSCFENNRFWYYNQEVYPASFDKPLKVNQVNLEAEIGNSDIIIIMASTPNLHDFGWGFIENAYNTLKGIKEIPDENNKIKARIEHIRANIKSDKEWLKQISDKAMKKGISVDSMITIDAIWLMENDK